MVLRHVPSRFGGWLKGSVRGSRAKLDVAQSYPMNSAGRAPEDCGAGCSWDAVEMGRREDDPCRAEPGRFDQVGPACRPAARSRQVWPAASNHRPSGRQRSWAKCGRPQFWDFPPACSKRTCRLNARHCGGYNGRSSGRIGIRGTLLRHGRRTARRRARRGRAPPSTLVNALRDSCCPCPKNNAHGGQWQVVLSRVDACSATT